MRSIKLRAALAMTGAILLLLVAGTCDLKAQVASGSILGGRQRHQQRCRGERNITCTSVETGVARKATTDSTGAYLFAVCRSGITIWKHPHRVLRPKLGRESRLRLALRSP